MAPVDTIAQLVRSDLTPYGYNTFVRDLAQYSSDPDTIQLGGRLKLVPPNMTVQFLMGKENFNAIFENKHYLKYLSMKILPSTMHDIAVNRIDPRQRLHVMHECLRSFPVAIAMTPETPLKSAMTQIIHQLNAAGIIDYWLDTVVHSEVASKQQNANKTLQKEGTIFSAQLGGRILSPSSLLLYLYRCFRGGARFSSCLVAPVS